MFPFFETIRYYNKLAENLFFHQQRMEKTFLHFGCNCKINLLEIKFDSFKQENKILNNEVYKCKFNYDLDGNYSIQFEPYSIRKIYTFSFVDIGLNKYDFKYTDREWINKAFAEAKTDDVIFIENGLIKDASYANIVLYDGLNWVTPRIPLLQGTKRALLLKDKKIIEQDILAHQIKSFKKVKFINAMMHWDESPCIEL
jgi:4-amino-4-deoxychorismate lyase